MNGHLPCTATLSMYRHISTLNYLRLADTCLTRTVIYWLSVPAITDSANKCHVFDGHFNPKSLAALTLTCDRQFTQIPMLPSSDRKQYFISRVNSCVMNHVIVASSRLVTFVLRHHVVKVCVHPAMTKKRTIRCFEQGASCIERLLSSCQLVQQNANSMSGIRATGPI